MTPAAAQTILRRTIPAALPVLLVGAPGVGKTAIVTDLARELGCQLVVSHPVTGDPTDFRGLPWMVAGRAEFLPIGDLARLADLAGQPDRPAIWLIDDLGQATAATQAAVMQLVHRDGRALNGFALPSNVAVVACTNRAQDRAGVGLFLAPLLSRFTTVLTLEPDPVAFVHWAIRRGGFNPLVAAFLRWRPDHLLDQTRPEHSLEQRCSPRTWEHISRLLGLGLTPAQLHEPLAGAITPAVATEFLAFLQVFATLPNADLIRADPDRAPLPGALDVTYATAIHLALAARLGRLLPLLPLRHAPAARVPAPLHAHRHHPRARPPPHCRLHRLGHPARQRRDPRLIAGSQPTMNATAVPATAVITTAPTGLAATAAPPAATAAAAATTLAAAAAPAVTAPAPAVTTAAALASASTTLPTAHPTQPAPTRARTSNPLQTTHLAQRALLAKLNIREWTGRRADREITHRIAREHGADRARRARGRGTS